MNRQQPHVAGTLRVPSAASEDSIGTRSAPTTWRRHFLRIIAALLIVGVLSLPAAAYVEIPYTLGRLINESTHIVQLQVEKVDKTKNLIVYRKLKDLKGTHPQDVVKHNIGQAGFSPREWQTIMAWAEPGKQAVFFHNGGSSETCIDNYWYQAYPGEWWGMSHAEPYLLRSFAGKPQKLATIVTQMLEGKEVIVPCMIDGDKNALQTATARVQRLRNSLKLVEYNAARDFVGWGGNEDFRRLQGMPGFGLLGQIGQTGPEAGAIAAADFNADGKTDLFLCGGGRAVLMKNDGQSFVEVSLPYSGPARSADWIDLNGDGQLDLLLATPSGPKILTHKGDTFQDDSGDLPLDGYTHCTAAAWIHADEDKHPDVLISQGFLGLRLFKNLGPAAPGQEIQPSVSPWHLAGPFDNPGGQGFSTEYPPEKNIDLGDKFTGKNGMQFGWKEHKFPDGQVNSLALFGPASDNAAFYLYREIMSGPTDIPVSFGSDDTLTVWLNGEKLISENQSRGATPDQNKTTLKLRRGKNQLLLKVCNGSGETGFYYRADGQPTKTRAQFVEHSVPAGLGPTGLGSRVRGDRLAVVDVDGDGRQDFISTGGEGVIVRNTPQGFVAVDGSGVKFQTGGVTPIWTDLNGDQRPDLLVPQRTGCKMFQNVGGGKFQDASSTLGVLAQANDALTSITVAPPTAAGTSPVIFAGCWQRPNRSFRLQAGQCVETTLELGLNQMVFNTRGLAAGDFNKDGALDVAFNNDGQDAVVLLGKADGAVKP